MDEVRLGSVIRAVRVRLRLRQADVGRRAGVSSSTISRIERGRITGLSVGTVQRVASVLDVRLEWVARWRGGELDRLLHAGHGAMHEALAAELTAADWLVAPEVSFSIYGERGIIDMLAYHPPTRSLCVVELKTQLVEVDGLIGAVDRYRRLAPGIAAERGWDVGSVSAWVVLRDTGTNRRRLAAHATVLRAAFPHDGRQMRGWLADPQEPVAALSFLPDSPRMRANAGSAGVQRVRLPPPSVAPKTDPPARSRGDASRRFSGHFSR